VNYGGGPPGDVNMSANRKLSAKVLAVTAAIAGGIIMTAVFAQIQGKSATNGGVQTKRARYLPEYTADGDLILPKNFEEWVYVGSPLTPNALNGGQLAESADREIEAQGGVRVLSYGQRQEG
jgi:hypothetical protein